MYVFYRHTFLFEVISELFLLFVISWEFISVHKLQSAMSGANANTLCGAHRKYNILQNGAKFLKLKKFLNISEQMNKQTEKKIYTEFNTPRSNKEIKCLNELIKSIKVDT